jgi:hypothetical protein
VIWDGAVDYLQTINFKTEVEALATARSDTLYTASGYSPTWVVDSGPLDDIEDYLPIIRLDELDWPHDSAQKTADNYVQYWRIQKVLAWACIGSDARDAERRSRDVRSVLVNAWMGSGSRLGMSSSTTGIVTSWLTGGGWRTTSRNDGFLTVAQMLLTVEFKATLPRS